jgi:uncharacterized protein
MDHGLKPSVLILPGIGNSGRQHWQTLWAAANPEFRRLQQRDWDHPKRDEWVEALELAVAHQAGAETVLVAHSLACLTVAHWAAQTRYRTRAALLVAVPDPEGANFPKQAQGFSPVPLEPFAFKSVVVTSLDDPYASLQYSQRCAEAWGATLVNVGKAGHINASSGLGGWPEGFRLLQELMESP